MPSTSPWGKQTKGVFTVDKTKNPYIIKPRPTRNIRKKQPIRKGMFSLTSEFEKLGFTDPFAITNAEKTSPKTE